MMGELALGEPLRIPPPRFNELDALEAIQKYKATMFEGVPTMYLYLLSYPDLENSSQFAHALHGRRPDYVCGQDGRSGKAFRLSAPGIVGND